MKLKEFMIHVGCKTEEDLRQYFSRNLKLGMLPVALYTCLKCNEIVDDIQNHKCEEQ